MFSANRNKMDDDNVSDVADGDSSFAATLSSHGGDMLGWVKRKKKTKKNNVFSFHEKNVLVFLQTTFFFCFSYILFVGLIIVERACERAHVFCTFFFFSSSNTGTRVLAQRR